jgi:hypothetical protein
MRLSIRVWAGLYGLAFHAVAVGLALWTARRNQADIPASFWWAVVPPLLVAAFVVYALVVASYVPKRPTHRMTVFYDCVVTMLAEVVVLAVTSVLYALLISRGALAGGLGAYLSASANMTAFAFLWTLGSFFLQVLVIGNAAGFLGWWVMKKIGARHAAPQG